MTVRTKTWLRVAGILLLAASALMVVLPSDHGGALRKYLPGIRLGLDLQGGTQLVYQADMNEIGAADRESALDGVREVIERRVNAFGVTEPIVQIIRGGTPRVLVELPGIGDVEAAIRQIGETPQLDFREEVFPTPTPSVGEATGRETEGSGPGFAEHGETTTWQRTPLSGRHLTRAAVAFDPQTGSPQVQLVFDGEGRRLFGEITERTVGKRIAIFLDGVPITAPVVQEKITAGEAVITGSFTIPEAKQLATRLNAGALPVPITLATRTTVGPSLGRDAWIQSLSAGILGVFLITAIMLILYRLPGLVALLALAFYGLLLFALLNLLGATLTVSGIAGFLLSLGMAVDANILVFERLKESIRAGHLLSTALLDSFREAWPSIRDSNIASLMTAGLLYAFGSNVVRGFATTLALGILVSMFTAIVVTRTILRTLQFMKIFHHLPWYASLYSPASVPSIHSFSIVRTRKYWLMGSLLLLGLSAAALGVFGLRPGIDFTGGSLIELQTTHGTPAEVRAALTQLGETHALVQDTGAGTLLIRLPPLSTEAHQQFLAKLTPRFPGLEEVRFETIGPTIGRELLRKAFFAVVAAVILILVYLALVFRKTTVTVSSWAFGTIAIVALLHDLFIMTGGFSLLTYFRGASADSLFLTAALTLLGFSVHDTIVVFNRVKTNLFRLRLPFRDLLDRSVTETFTRSINTSATTLFVLLPVLLFGGASVWPFAATLSLGIVVGTYSSIGVAAPLLVYWQERGSGRS